MRTLEQNNDDLERGARVLQSTVDDLTSRLERAQEAIVLLQVEHEEMQQHHAEELAR